MALAPLYSWLFLLNLLCITPYTYGPRSFICLLASVFILWQLSSRQLSSHLSPLLSKPNSYLALSKTDLNILKYLCMLTIIIAGSAIIFALSYSNIHQTDWLIDIAANTYAAVEFFAKGENPYTSNAQLLVTHFSNDMPNIEINNGQITMFGIPYFNGYPYFPLMMLSYTPLYAIFESYTAIRVTHIILILLNIFAFKLLIDKLLPDKKHRTHALLIAITAYLGIVRYTLEAVAFGVTDMLIATYIIFCFVALTHQRFLLAGLLLGCAQACKLLPAPFVLIGILWMLYGHRSLWRFLVGYIMACSIFILPFLLWHAEGFISATILYYLTHHEGGDFTSLWFFLPKIIQPVFTLLGIALTLASILLFGKRGKLDFVGCMAGSYASYVIFMSFSKMTHLNYLWAVLPMGCIALTILIINKTSAQTNLHN